MTESFLGSRNSSHLELTRFRWYHPASSSSNSKRVSGLWFSAQRECYGVSCLILYQDTTGSGLGLPGRGGGAEQGREGTGVSYF